MSEVNDPLRATFEAVRGAWDDESKHSAFVALATQLRRLDEAAKMYRDLRHDPTLSPRVEKSLGLIVAAALATVDNAPRTSVEAMVAKTRWLAPVLAACMFVLLGWLYSEVTHTPAMRSPAAIVLEIVVALLIPWHRFRSSRSLRQ